MFTISWGGFILIGGDGFLSGSDWQTDSRFLPAVLVMIAGPPVAGILLTILYYGKEGMRNLLSQLLRMKAGVRWYAIAIFLAPFVQLAVLLPLSLFSPVFLPAVMTAEVKSALLIPGISMGLVGGLLEELGWTGFTIPGLRKNYSVFRTGLIVGILWGIWHLLQMIWVGSTSTGTIPPVIFLTLYFIFAILQLTAFRILMVWVYDHTKSLFIALLMHASYIFTTLFVFAPPTEGLHFLIYSGGFTVGMWVVVGAIVAYKRKEFFDIVAG